MKFAYQICFRSLETNPTYRYGDSARIRFYIPKQRTRSDVKVQMVKPEGNADGFSTRHFSFPARGPKIFKHDKNWILRSANTIPTWQRTKQKNLCVCKIISFCATVGHPSLHRRSNRAPIDRRSLSSNWFRLVRDLTASGLTGRPCSKIGGGAGP